MTDTIEQTVEAEPGVALQDFNDGYTAAQRGEPVEKGRSATYKRAHAAAVKRQKEQQR